MRVTKWGEYGILCSLYLARNAARGPVGAAEISEAQVIPLQYTQQILQRLRRGGIIESSRGPHGGYSLCRKPEETTLKEILYAAEGDTFEIICESNPIYPDQCGNSTCGLHAVWSELKTAVDTLLSSRSLSWVIEKEAQGTANELVTKVGRVRTPSSDPVQ
jgi:Rrf2 family iron-sulfur cluster assembly transcriptional regulator